MLPNLFNVIGGATHPRNIEPAEQTNDAVHNMLHKIGGLDNTMTFGAK